LNGWWTVIRCKLANSCPNRYDRRSGAQRWCHNTAL
jgi:hypothetical protein